MATEHLDLWESLIGTRKSPLRQAGIVGLGILFRVMMHSIALEELVEKVCARIGIKGRAIQWPYADACMDVDKPHQLELMREDLVKQQRKDVVKARRAADVDKAKSEKPVSRRSSGVKKVAAVTAARTLTKPKATSRKK